jgi:hypothetical protein
VVIAGTLLVAFSLAGGLGIVFNNTPAIVAGWVGFAVTLLAAYWTAPAGPSERARPRSTEGG